MEQKLPMKNVIQHYRWILFLTTQYLSAQITRRNSVCKCNIHNFISNAHQWFQLASIEFATFNGWQTHWSKFHRIKEATKLKRISNSFSEEIYVLYRNVSLISMKKNWFNWNRKDMRKLLNGLWIKVIV